MHLPWRQATPLLVVCLLAVSCAAAPSASPQASAPGAQSTGVASSSAPTGSAAAETPAIPTSESLIADALAAGSITYEQSLLDRALALFNSPGLPAAFDSPVPDMHAGEDLFREIDAKEPTLGADLLRQLAPYRARPNDPISIFNVPPTQARVNAVTVADTVPVWKSQVVSGGAARVWVKDSPDAAAQLNLHATDVARVWAAFPDLFTYPEPDQADVPTASINPDSAIDFYFVDASDLDPRRPACIINPSLPACTFGTKNNGYAQIAPQHHGNSSSGYLVIDAGISGDLLVETLAHELTHAGQFAYDRNESSWLMESTATWVAYRVMKKLNRTPSYAYAYLPELFAGLDQTLTRPGNNNANSYASWLYFQFAAMEAGPQMVQAIWEAAGADGVQGVKAVDSVFSFDQHFADFSVRDWNKDPVQPQYKTPDDTFPSGYQPNTRNRVKALEGGKQDSLDVSLPPLASAYYEYVFPASTRDITFENTLAGVAGAHVWAIKNVNEDWKRPEDWTSTAKKTFCRDIPEEDVGQVIIVVSNSSLTDSLKVSEPPKVIAGTKGCSGWSGTMTGTEVWNWPGAHGKGTTTFTGVWEQVPVDDQVQPCQAGLPDSCTAYYPHGTIHWTWDAHVANPACDTTKAGDATPGLKNDPQSAIFAETFYLQPDGSGHYGYWGISSWAEPKVDCLSGNGESLPSYYDVPQEASGSGGGGAGGNECNATTWQIDAAATTITGSCSSFDVTGHSLLFEWNLKRIGPAPGAQP